MKGSLLAYLRLLAWNKGEIRAIIMDPKSIQKAIFVVLLSPILSIIIVFFFLGDYLKFFLIKDFFVHTVYFLVFLFSIFFIARKYFSANIQFPVFFAVLGRLQILEIGKCFLLFLFYLLSSPPEIKNLMNYFGYFSYFYYLIFTYRFLVSQFDIDDQDVLLIIFGGSLFVLIAKFFVG